MVAGKSGFFELSGENGMTAKVSWSEQYSFDDNQSVVSIDNIQFKTSLYNYWVTYYFNGPITVGDTKVVEFSSFQGTHRVNLNGKDTYFDIIGNPTPPWTSGIIDHDADGSKSVTISLDITGINLEGKYGSGWKITGSVTIDLTDIARASSITDISDIVLGSPFTVTWTPASADFRNRLMFFMGDWSHTTDPIHPNTTGEYKYRYTIPLEVAEQIPDSNTGEMGVELHTYSDADATVQVGSSSDWDVMVTVPENDLTRPTVNVILDAVSPSLPDTFDGLFIQGKTKVQVDLLADGKYGATIESYSMKQAARSSNTDGHFVTDYLSTPGETTITGYATDSRGFTGSASKDITVLAYIKPKILPTDDESEVVASRCDADGNLSSSGTYLKIKAKRSYTLLTADGYQHNYCAIQFRYKQANAETFSDWVTILDGGSLDSDEVDTDALLGGVLSAQSTYAVEIRVIDDVGDSNFTTIYIPTDTVYMHRTRNAMGLGKYVEGGNLLDVAWDAHFRGEVRLGETGMTLKEYILAVISEGG